MSPISESDFTTVNEALRAGRQRTLRLLGQVDRNQGLPTFTGRLTLEQFADLTVVHNRRWAEEAGESLDVVTQREIIDAHADGLATFLLQGLVEATVLRLKKEDPGSAKTVVALEKIQDNIGRSGHYALPQVTLVLPGEADVSLISNDGECVAARLSLPAGRLFLVADGQHRREAARKVREFLTDLITSRRLPRKSKVFPSAEGPLDSDQLDAWIVVQETFRSWSMISFEAHIGLSVDQARQMFTNYNCHTKPVKAELNLEFDQSNPINKFGKEFVHELVKLADGSHIYDLRQLATINGFLFLGKTTIKSAPYHLEHAFGPAKEFWNTVTQCAEWDRPGTLLRDVPVLKGLAKAWFYVFVAKRNNQLPKAEVLRSYIRRTMFDRAWLEAVPGLMAHTVPAENAVGLRFSPAHNDIVATIVAHSLGNNPG